MSLITAADKAALAELFTQRVTIQAETEISVGLRGETRKSWANVSGLVALPAQIVPNVLRADEAPGSGTGAVSSSTHEITMLDYYPAINERHRLIDDATGEAYNILLSSKDPTGAFGMLKARKVSA